MNRTLLPRLFGERPERFGAALPSSPGESFRTERNVFFGRLRAGRRPRSEGLRRAAARGSAVAERREPAKGRQQDSESGGNRIPMDEPRAPGMM